MATVETEVGEGSTRLVCAQGALLPDSSVVSRFLHEPALRPTDSGLSHRTFLLSPEEATPGGQASKMRLAADDTEGCSGKTSIRSSVRQTRHGRNRVVRDLSS
jgi:hypothetical protein